MPDNIPQSGELIAALKTFLDQDIAPQVNGRSRYLLKVAANLLDIIERDARQGAPAIDREAVRLSALLGTGEQDASTLNALLCERISDGSMTLDDEALWRHLLLTTADRLAIDSPRYKFLPVK